MVGISKDVEGKAENDKSDEKGAGTDEKEGKRAAEETQTKPATKKPKIDSKQTVSDLFLVFLLIDCCSNTFYLSITGNTG